MKITVIGLGAMGAPMAGHLLTAGHEVTGYARDPNKFEGPLADLVAGGLIQSHDLSRCAESAAVVIINVTSTDDVLQVIKGIAPSLSPNTLVIDHSTISLMAPGKRPSTSLGSLMRPYPAAKPRPSPANW